MANENEEKNTYHVHVYDDKTLVSKRLLDEVFVISRIIKVEVGVISQS